MSTRRRVLTLALLMASTPAGAQGRISGVLFDSLLTNRPLAGATVIVVGSTLSRSTDERGRFRFDSVPAGKQLITFFHGLLDSIGLGASTLEVQVADNSDATVRLDTPSGASLRALFCPSLTDSTTGLLIGKVRDVDTGVGLADASVATTWMELTFDRGPKPQTFHATTKSVATGAYVLCGVPLDVPIFVRAWLGDQASGFVEVFGESRAVAFQHLAISLTDSTSRLSVDSLVEEIPIADRARPAGSATLAGRVLEVNGRPVRGARVILHVGGAATETDRDGGFRLAGLPAGTQAIDIRAIGFAPVRRAIDLRSGIATDFSINLDRKAAALPTVHVLGSARLERAGFFQRERVGHGYFLREQQIERMGGAMAIDVVQRAPGLIPQYFRGSGGRTVRGVVMRRSGPGSCVPNLFIDGFNYPGAWDQLVNFLQKSEIVAVEVYTSTVSVPAQFDRANGCGSVVIWTRP